MTPQLFSIEHAPAALPYWQTIWDDLGRPPGRRIARVLGISERTVYRYHQAGHAPRVVLLALFWLTRWGRSAVHVQATNDALMAVSLVRGLESDLKRLSAQVSHLERLGGYGTANEPLRHGLGYGAKPHGEPSSIRSASGSDLGHPPATPAGIAVTSTWLAPARPESSSPDPTTPLPPTPAGKRRDATAADAAGSADDAAGRVRTDVVGPGPEGPPA